MARSGVLTFKTPEEMQEKIDEYFKDCEGHPLFDDNECPVMDKFGYPVIIDRKPLTVTGLALALGFTNRQTLLNYQHRSKKFQEIVERAKLRIENYAEMRLYDKDGSNGAKFNLQNNFRHWNADKEKDDGSKYPAINIICDIPKSDNPSNMSDVADMSIDPQAVQEMRDKALAEIAGGEDEQHDG